MIAQQKLSDEECDTLRGKHLDDTYYDTLITEDMDCLREDGSILFKFRKSICSKDEQEVAFLAFKNLAKATHSRGASAGPIDPNSTYWKKRKIIKISPGGWSANYENVSGKSNNMKIQNEVASNIIGYWSETKGIGQTLPCRLSHYSRKEFLKEEDGYPFLQRISKSYKNLHPEWYEKQMEQVNMNPDFAIGDTPFSTITINRNFRTAVHKDAGDYGFGNLSVLEYGHYHGGYFILPKYRIAIDMRSGDHLCVDVHEYHANTALYETEEDKVLNDELPDIFKDNLDVGVIGLNNRYARISLVCYLRGELKKCEMELQDKYLQVIQPAETKLSVIYVNKLKDSEKRKKFYSTNWARSETHEAALFRIIKHGLKNVVIIDDTCNLIGAIKTSKKFHMRDGITFLNYENDTKKHGQWEFIGKRIEEGQPLAYYVPDSAVAMKILNPQAYVPSYLLYPPMFSN